MRRMRIEAGAPAEAAAVAEGRAHEQGQAAAGGRRMANQEAVRARAVQATAKANDGR